MRQAQHGLFLNPNEDGYRQLEKDQRDMKLALDQEKRELESMLQTFILPPNDLHRVEFLHNELTLQHKQLEVRFGRGTNHFILPHSFIPAVPLRIDAVGGDAW